MFCQGDDEGTREGSVRDVLDFVEKRVRLSLEGFAARARDAPTGTEGDAAAMGEDATNTGDDTKVCLWVSFPTVGSRLALLFGVLTQPRRTIADAHPCPHLFSRTFCLHFFSGEAPWHRRRQRHRVLRLDDRAPEPQLVAG